MLHAAPDLPRFSRALGELHAAPDPRALRTRIAATLLEFFPAEKPATRVKWIRAFESAREGDARRRPGVLRRHFLLELLWAHVADCHARVKPAVARTGPPTATVAARRLTSRENEVLAGIAHGQTDAAIARRLGIGARTVGQHVQHILEKLGVESRAAAVAVIRPRNTAHRD